MPTIDINVTEFEKLLGISYQGNVEKLDEDLSYVKSEVKAYSPKDNTVSIEIKDTNRPDLWGVEGLARGLRSYLGKEEGPRRYSVEPSAIDVQVGVGLKDIRPYIACAVVKDMQLNDIIIKGLMHLQDKLDKTHGRSRQKTSIGLYNLDLIKPPLSYVAVKPSQFNFTPLGFSEKLTMEEILERHPKGQEYGHIVKKHSMYPILLDSENRVLSFPPIINSNDLGCVTEDAHNLLVEVTGTVQQTVHNVLTLVSTALVDRGGKAYAATVHYPQNEAYPQTTVVTPDFSSRKINLNTAYTNRITGLQLDSGNIAQLLPVAGLGVDKVAAESVEVLVPCYRVDVMHPVDIVEDVAVAFGYNNIEPLWRDLPTTGQARPQQRRINVARELMVGAGYQEILNYTLTNPENLFTKMNMPKEDTVVLANPKVVTMTCLRNHLLPGIMEFLSVNQSVEFPQRVFELGRVSLPDATQETKTRDEDWLAAAVSHATASFSEIKACLDTLFINLGVTWQISSTVHSSFIEGRTGAINVNGASVGVLGEVHPAVLEAWKLENPTAAFELNLQAILANQNS